MEAPKLSEPLPAVSDREFVSAIGSESAAKNLSPEETRNRARAAESLSHIFALRDSTAFDWFWREILQKKIEEAEKALKFGANGVTLEVRLARWRSLAEVHDWFVNLEISHRKTLDPKDPEIKRLHGTLLVVE